MNIRRALDPFKKNKPCEGWLLPHKPETQSVSVCHKEDGDSGLYLQGLKEKGPQLIL